MRINNSLAKTGLWNDGSIDKDAGGDNHLAVVLSVTSYLNVECENKQAPPRTSCGDITSDMYVSMEKKTFGPPGTDSDIDTPWLMSSCKSRVDALYGIKVEYLSPY